MISNPILLTDSYKPSQWKQYPKDTTYVESYFESRTGAEFDTTVFFGLQALLIKHLEGGVVTMAHIDEAQEVFQAHFGQDLFNREGWEYIVNHHDGRLPIQIDAVSEGSVIPVSNMMMRVHNTDPRCAWLTSYIEGLLVQLWYPCTVATNSREIKKVIAKYVEDDSGIEFMLHDFGFRGATCVEQAEIGGASHLINFRGTDNLPAMNFLRQYYGGGLASGNSIPASEHSTMTAWGKEREVDAYRNMLEQFPFGLVACVSDSWNIYNAVDNIWGKELKDMIMERNGTLVIRPDSGNPPEVIRKLLHSLWENFGGTTTPKGKKLLDPHVRVIQGDGIDLDMVKVILQRMNKEGFAAENLAFGSGGGLLQKMNRDTQRFAFKACYTENEYGKMDVYKDPVGSKGKKTKISKKGQMKLISVTHGSYSTVPMDSMPDHKDRLTPVFRNGEILRICTLDDVRGRVAL